MGFEYEEECEDEDDEIYNEEDIKYQKNMVKLSIQ
jgi:hypothetical protein